MASWAAGKDLAGLVSTVGELAGALPAASGLPTLDAHKTGVLRSQPAALRRAYRKALLCCHPDKHVSTPADEQAVAAAVFHALSSAFAAAATADQTFSV